MVRIINKTHDQEYSSQQEQEKLLNSKVSPYGVALADLVKERGLAKMQRLVNLLKVLPDVKFFQRFVCPESI